MSEAVVSAAFEAAVRQLPPGDENPRAAEVLYVLVVAARRVAEDLEGQIERHDQDDCADGNCPLCHVARASVGATVLLRLLTEHVDCLLVRAGQLETLAESEVLPAVRRQVDGLHGDGADAPTAVVGDPH
jgi:hypothetical protein